MKLAAIVLIISFLASTLPAMAAQPKVTVRAVAVAQSDFVTLGDIADISPSPQASKASARLAATVVGRAPMPGESRPLTRGDILLKLRQAGINPATVDVEGASDITISSTQLPQAVTAPALPSSTGAPQASPTTADPTAPAIRVGDPVDIVLADGLVTVRARGTAVTGGTIGKEITVRRDNAPRTLTGIIIAPGRVELEE